ncbi:GNAT family N-acetyltransferase [Microlunatus speluncae]|uniref:GNAT family N-acetyltransferase n=1 Tax=Microlunatus speluncae TaxID=2594267 RepID=UPI0012661323|nr:GNAT family N-acetyltransferase [Microlunatus speluncae]
MILDLSPTGPDDFAELRRLFDDPAFLDWGGPGRASDSLIREKYCGSRAPAIECFLVRLDGVVTGLAQLHRADDDGEGGGMDLIILPSARGHGVGREIVRRLIRRAISEHGWRRITVDPDVDNRAGIEFWRSVGFAEVARHDGRDERPAYVLMSWAGPLSPAGSG